MIGRAHRFHGYHSLRSVYRHGKTARATALNLRYSRRTSHKPYRVAVVVSRKVHKSAVTRNRIRRRIYEAVRLADSVVPPGTDLVFTVFSDQLADMPAPQLQEQVAGLLEKAAKTPVRPG